MSASSYRAHENGQNSFDLDQAEVYAKKFGVTPLYLMGKDNIAPPIEPPSDSPNARVLSKIEDKGRKTIPVFGRAVGGVDGEFDMNGSELFSVLAPPSIAGYKGAYAIQVSGDSMSPRYEDGEICFIDPKRRVKRGDYVVVQIKLEDEGPLLAYVKRFVRHNAVEIVLEQFNPAKELRFPSSAVESVHYIALAGEAE